MREAQWLTCDEPAKMLGHLRGEVSVRKLRLFAVAMWRGHLDIMRRFGAEEVPDIGERYADGLATEDEVDRSRHALDLRGANLPYPQYVEQASRHLIANLAPGPQVGPEKRRQAALLREIVGNPFRQFVWTDRISGAPSHRDFDAGDLRPHTILRRHWITPTVQAMAEHAYQERDFAGLPAIADALEEAGCEEQAMLDHLRSAGPHCRGCHVLDLILGRE